MKPLDFKITKMSGAGNDFLFLDFTDLTTKLNWDAHFNSRPDFTRTVCRRQHNVGADGVVFVEKLENENGPQIKWDFYNADGSTAEMCGNAARCMGVYCFKRGISPKSFDFLSLAGTIHVEVINNEQVSVLMPAIQNEKWGEVLNIEGQGVNFDYMDSGVPHAVIFVNEINENTKNKNFVSQLRNHISFSPKGTNVTFTKVINENSINSVSFERGVEDFTLACGTGAVASAFAFHKKNPDTRVINVSVPGGDLVVDLSSQQPILTGPAKFIAEVELYI